MSRLQERRLELGLSQPDVSAKLKEIDPRMDVGMVSRFERGACLPTPEVLEGLEAVLQASRTELFDEDELGVIPGAEAAERKIRAPARPAAWEEDEQCSEREIAESDCEGCGTCEDDASPMTATLAAASPFGRRNAIRRDVLAAKLRMSDRQMRKAIEDARNEGLIILCECNGRGYYQSNDLVEIQHQYKQDTARAMAILKRRKPMRALLKAAGRNV